MIPCTMCDFFNYGTDYGLRITTTRRPLIGLDRTIEYVMNQQTTYYLLQGELYNSPDMQIMTVRSIVFYSVFDTICTQIVIQCFLFENHRSYG